MASILTSIYRRLDVHRQYHLKFSESLQGKTAKEHIRER